MSTAIIILGFFCLVLTIGLILTTVVYRNSKKDAREKYKELAQTVECPVLLWSADLKDIRANGCMNGILMDLGKKADKELIAEIFGTDTEHSEINPAALLVNALTEKGISSNIANPETNATVYIHWKSTALYSVKSKAVIASVGKDDTRNIELYAALESYKEKESLMSEMFDLATENEDTGIIRILFDTTQHSIELSLNSYKLLGIQAGTKLNLSDLKKYVHAADYNDFSSNVDIILHGLTDSLNLEAKFYISASESHLFKIKLRSVKNESRNILYITGILIDVERRREKLNIFDRSAFEDPVSGLPNQRAFLNKAKSFLKEKESDGSLTVMMSVKIRNMLKTAALYGIDATDNIIKLFAEGLQRCVKGKAILGRIGNDDFAVLCTQNDTDGIERFAKDLLIFLENSIEILPAELCECVYFDVGVCVHDGIDDEITLFNKANIMHYTNEFGNTGTICRYYNENVEKKIMEHDIIEYEIAHALKNSEFEMYYQPKVSVTDGKLLGAEALIRWNHPTRGLVKPYEFLSIAEEIGILTKIDEWGLTEACRQARRWQLKGYDPIRISSNMSKKLFYETDIVETVKTALEESNLDPMFFELELTETVAVKNITLTIEILEKLKALGVIISMDDFGSGYSSLANLKHLPIDILKIDRSLVYDIDVNPTSQKMIKAIVEMGKAMGLRVVSEGVETKIQLDILTELGCDEAQGYFYGQPISVAEIEKNFFLKN